jgi:hypothetical protein
MFSNGSAPLTALTMGPLMLEVPWPGSILWAHMFAGDVSGQPVAVSATVTLNITRVTTFGGLLPIHGITSIPTLTAQSSATLDTTDWVQNLLPGDAVMALLTSFVGTATWLSLHLLLYPTEVPQGSSTIIDDTGDVIIDDEGNRVVLRV